MMTETSPVLRAVAGGSLMEPMADELARLTPRAVEPGVVRVVLAEDDGGLRSDLAALLSLGGYTVDELATGAQLVEHLASAILEEPRSARPDVIITDVRMPGVNGLHVAEGLRANGWVVPMIILSGFADARLRSRVDALGGAVLLEKPFAAEDLEDAVTDLLRQA